MYNIIYDAFASRSERRLPSSFGRAHFAQTRSSCCSRAWGSASASLQGT